MYVECEKNEVKWSGENGGWWWWRWEQGRDGGSWAGLGLGVWDMDMGLGVMLWFFDELIMWLCVSATDNWCAYWRSLKVEVSGLMIVMRWSSPWSEQFCGVDRRLVGRMGGWELRDLRGVFGCREFEGGRSLYMKRPFRWKACMQTEWSKSLHMIVRRGRQGG